MAQAAAKKTPKPAPKKRAATAPAPILAIKGMDLDMSCRGHKFETGKTYTVTGKVRACDNGFHSCPLDGETSPLSVFEYYAPGTSRFFEVEASGETDRQGNKLASASITVGVEIGVGDLVARFIEWVMARAKPTGETTNSGTRGAASNSGTRGAASNSGTRGAASNSGTRGAASNSGYSGAASNSGYSGAAFSHAYGGKVMCEGDEQVLSCSEFDDNFKLVSHASGITGRDGIKAGVWYRCEAGKLVEASK